MSERSRLARSATRSTATWRARLRALPVVSVVATMIGLCLHACAFFATDPDSLATEDSRKTRTACTRYGTVSCGCERTEDAGDSDFRCGSSSTSFCCETPEFPKSLASTCQCRVVRCKVEGRVTTCAYTLDEGAGAPPAASESGCCMDGESCSCDARRGATCQVGTSVPSCSVEHFVACPAGMTPTALQPGSSNALCER